MHSETLYIPIDRLYSIANHENLPENTQGAALFADISGFTPLTEALARVLGAGHGAEELTRHLNNVYNVLIAEVDRFGGSVIGFSGDAITCWYTDDAAQSHTQPAALRAVATGIAMQEGMKAFAAIKLPDGSTAKLEMKAAVAKGPARRFLVGDPAIQLIDTIAGETIARMAAAEHLANRGDIIVDEATVAALGDSLIVREWRTEAHDSHDSHIERKFAAIDGLREPVDSSPWSPLRGEKLENLSEDQIRAWVLGPVYERLKAGLGDVMTELRPAVALFLRFLGIDYDHDPEAGKKLDSFIRHIQAIFSHYEGFVIQLTIGDKGSYLYATFGGLIAHEDDPSRAVKAALDIRAMLPEFEFMHHVQIGITQGLMRVGTYGGDTRHTYGVLGDEVNLAARLMQHAAPGDILISKRIQKAIGDSANVETMPPIRVKGKSDPVTLARVVGKGARADSTGFTGKLIGRDGELATLTQWLEPIFTSGKFAGVAIVYGEAGMGKSRLVYELHTQTMQDKDVHWFFCPAEPLVHQSLYAFRHFLRDYFAHDSEGSYEENKSRFDEVFDALLSDIQDRGNVDLSEDLEHAHSFLAALTGLHWDGSLYEQLEPKLRHENLLLAVRTFIEAESLGSPVILQIEDLHWLDADSQELLGLLTTNIDDYPLAILCTSRYRDDGSRVVLDIDAEVSPTIVDLNRLSADGTRAMAAQHLENPISDRLNALLYEKTGGSPFFLEQMLYDLRERGFLEHLEHADGITSIDIDPGHVLEIPSSVNALLISRLDRLMAEVKAVVQTASVLGQEFDTDVLWKMFQADEHLPTKVKQAESQAVWAELNEIRYTFRHALLRDVAYDMQIRARLRQLHRLAGNAIEQVYAHDLADHYADLVHHFRKAEDPDAERRYTLLTAEYAAEESANGEAIEYYSRALELTPADDLALQVQILLGREHLYDLGGNRPCQLADIETLTELTERLRDREKQIEVKLRKLHYTTIIHDYAATIAAAQSILASGEKQHEAVAILWLARGYIGLQDYPEARKHLHIVFELAKRDNQPSIEADAMRELGIVADALGEYDEARTSFESAFAFYETAGFQRGECKTLNNLGMVALAQNDLPQAQHYFEHALHLCHAIGYRHTECRVLINLGKLALKKGFKQDAKSHFEKAQHLAHEIHDHQQEQLAAQIALTAAP